MYAFNTFQKVNILSINSIVKTVILYFKIIKKITYVHLLLGNKD